VSGAEVLPVGLVAQHVPGGGKHGSGHGEDCERCFEEASGDVGDGMVDERQARALARR
jgi:hypothetical protein